VTSPDDIADLLPASGARVLITSRFSDWVEMADEVALDVLPAEQAIAFLQTRTGRNDPQGARTVSDALGYLPLALDHASAYCRRTQMRFADYAAKATSLMDTAPRGVGYPRSVAATFDLAISQAVTQCAAVEALMAFLAQCGPERIPMLLVEGAIDDEAEGRQALASLAELSLVKHVPFDDGTNAAVVHRLVQSVARFRSKEKGQRKGAVERLITQLSRVYPADGYSNPGSWPLLSHLTPHVLAFRTDDINGPSKGEHWHEILDHGASYFHGRGAYSQAASLFKDALAVREKLFGPEHAVTAKSFNDLGLLLQHQGDFAGARTLHERALSINEKTYGFEHPDTAISYCNLAQALQRQGDLAGARALYDRALAIRERVCGPAHRDTAGVINNLACLLHVSRDLEGARQFYKRTLAIYEKEFGLDHPDTALILNNLAFLLHDQGDLSGARPLFERALAIHEKVLGPEHPTTSTDMSNFARLLKDAGNFDEAEPLFRRAIAVGNATLGRDHPQTHRYASHYARLLLKTGRAEEALTMAQSALATHEATSEAMHPWTKDSACVTADALDALGRTDEAKALRERYGLEGPEGPQGS
jgi:tetratricopeptide (TPR) repeat protein